MDEEEFAASGSDKKILSGAVGSKQKQSGHKQKKNSIISEVDSTSNPKEGGDHTADSPEDIPPFGLRIVESDFITRNNSSVQSMFTTLNGKGIGEKQFPSITINATDVKRGELEGVSSSHELNGSVIPEAVLYYDRGSVLVRDENTNSDGGCDLYGRCIYNIRHMYTDNDQTPLECV